MKDQNVIDESIHNNANDKNENNKIHRKEREVKIRNVYFLGELDLYTEVERDFQQFIKNRRKLKK